MKTTEAMLRCVAGTAVIASAEFAYQDSTHAAFHAMMYFLVGATWWSFAAKSRPGSTASATEAELTSK